MSMGVVIPYFWNWNTNKIVICKRPIFHRASNDIFTSIDCREISRRATHLTTS
jgi:hypothetical protein